MLVTVENQLSVPIQTADAVDYRGVTNGPADLYAVGGNVNNPLPFPFDRVGELDANGGANDSVQRAMHPDDFHNRHNLWRGMEPGTEWNQIIQEGKVTFAIASESGRTHTEELFITAV